MDQDIDTAEAAEAVKVEFLKIRLKDTGFSSNENSSALPNPQHFSTSSTNPNSNSPTDQKPHLLVQTPRDLVAQAHQPGRSSGSSRSSGKSQSTRRRQKYKTTMSARDCIAKFGCPALLALSGLVVMMYCLQIPCIPVFIIFATFVVTRHLMVCRMGSSHCLEVKVLFGRRSKSLDPAYWVYIMGSGGHTAELADMIELHHTPCHVNSHRRYIVTDGDTSSEARIRNLEDCLYKSDYDHKQADKDAETYGYVMPGYGSSDFQVLFGDSSDDDEDDHDDDHDAPFAATCDLLIMPRARAIHQSFLTAWFSSLQAALCAAIWMTEGPLMHRHREPRSVYSRFYKFPHVIVTNGPGSGFVIAVVAHLLKMFFLAPQDRLKVVFIETWAHVNTLSLTGKLFHWTGIADVFAVQHLALAQRYGKLYYPIITDRMRRVAE